MNELRQAAQQVVDAWNDPLGMKRVCEAMDALHAALGQPEQVWLTGCPSCGTDGGCDCDEGTYNPPRREWRGLTEEDVVRIYDDTPSAKVGAFIVRFARLIEAALKEKNHD
jgi:hypothetical protein